ncbi:50S ribosomal protein L14 [Candidatus Bathyarchaeota archaeon RBG_16_57_9]|nr:50S ribosomal protein L14, large subunit ribosomal protein L14 [uncultured archaeon]AJS13082.1 50S ribosomal protein L14, large subunit ribosomal protein L14 [uncultured archaeon]OGD45196.1 MAG: 50S ribosomal protein L14 [Candidatus Bathyarchaeota archaeon RBG_16_57_9]OGD54099.1 MAG: 50S ribosomal protein L14 [Candidatus Bathyarchaeota archaeon RBG_13_60_20]
MSKRIKRRILPRSYVAGGLTIGSVINCADNTGARSLRIIQMMGYKGRRRRLPAIGIGDLVMVSCREGTPEMRKQLFNAVIVRQRRPYLRADGTRIQFEDNAAVILTPEGTLRGSDVKGPVAREAANRWARLGNIARMVV